MSGSSVYWISPARILGWAAISHCRGSPHPGMEPKSTKSLALAGRLFYHCTTWEAQAKKTDIQIHSVDQEWQIIIDVLMQDV